MPPTAANEPNASRTTGMKKQRPRALGVAKSRTGCQTCKKRHRKCDETKPGCLACLVGGWRCDYLDSQAASKERSPRQPAGPCQQGKSAMVFPEWSHRQAIDRPPATFISSLTSSELLNLDKFKLNVQMVDDMFGIPEYARVLTLSIFSEPCIRYAGIAIAHVYTYDEKWRPVPDATTEKSRNALWYSNRAIRELNGSQVPKQASEFSGVALVTGSVLAGVSWHLGDSGQLLKHLSGLLKILKEKAKVPSVMPEPDLLHPHPSEKITLRVRLGTVYILWLRLLDQYLVEGTVIPEDAAELEATISQLDKLRCQPRAEHSHPVKRFERAIN